MDINLHTAYLIDEFPYLCIAKTDEYIIMAGFYSEDEYEFPILDMTEIKVYDAKNPEYGPIEKIMDCSGSGHVTFEFSPDKLIRGRRPRGKIPAEV